MNIYIVRIHCSCSDEKKKKKQLKSKVKNGVSVETERITHESKKNQLIDQMGVSWDLGLDLSCDAAEESVPINWAASRPLELSWLKRVLINRG